VEWAKPWPNVGDGLGGAFRFGSWILLQDGEYGVFIELPDLHHVDRRSELIGDGQIGLGEQLDVTPLGVKHALTSQSMVICITFILSSHVI
jgi:hypothetical protein